MLKAHKKRIPVGALCLNLHILGLDVLIHAFISCRPTNEEKNKHQGILSIAIYYIIIVCTFTYVRYSYSYVKTHICAIYNRKPRLHYVCNRTGHRF